MSTDSGPNSPLTSKSEALPKQSVELIRATLEDMRKNGLRSGLPQEHAFTLLEEIERLTRELAEAHKVFAAIERLPDETTGYFEEMKRLLWKDLHWTDRVEIIPHYMPPHPNKDTRPSVAIRYNSGSDHPPFLRYSAGPLQGYFWDVYGEDFQSIPMAVIAISQAPPPRSVDPITFTIQLPEKATMEDPK